MINSIDGEWNANKGWNFNSVSELKLPVEAMHDSLAVLFYHISLSYSKEPKLVGFFCFCCLVYWLTNKVNIF